MDSMGGNSQAQLRHFVDRIENINGQIDDLRADKAVIGAELKAAGFQIKYVNRVLKARAKKPHERQEELALEATYLHAMGLDTEPPIYRSIGALAKDATSREKVIEAFYKIVPAKGDIIVRIGGDPVRIFRDSEGNPKHEPYVEAGSEPPSAPDAPPPRQKPEVPAVDDEGAKELGRQYAKENRPVTDNPFPFGDKRRALFDEAWRSETGNDGMGKDD